MKKRIMVETNIAVFRGKEIRKNIHKNEWWFSIVDVCAVLTGSADAGAYWRKLKQRLKEEGSEVVTFCHGLMMPRDLMKARQPHGKAVRLQERPEKTLKRKPARGSSRQEII